MSSTKAVLAFFLALPLAAQTAAVPAVQIQPPNIVISVPCQQQTAPKNGGKFNLAMCPLTITPAPIKIAAQIAPVTLGNYTMTFTLTPAQLDEVKAAMASGSGSVTGITITLTAVK